VTVTVESAAAVAVELSTDAVEASPVSTVVELSPVATDVADAVELSAEAAPVSMDDEVELSTEAAPVSIDDEVELLPVSADAADAVELATEAAAPIEVPGTLTPPGAICLRAIKDASIRWGAATAEPAREAMRGRTARLNNIVKK
jgi:hypothetical protein